MPVSTVVTTPGGAYSNSFVTVAYVDQYQLDRPGFASSVAWAAATPDQKAAAVIYMSRRLSSLVQWEGYAGSVSQALAFPRYGLTGRNGYAIDPLSVPVEIQEITAEGAAQLLLEATVDAASGDTPQAQGLKRLKAGPVELEFSDAASAEAYSELAELLGTLPEEWGVLRGRSMTRRLVRA